MICDNVACGRDRIQTRGHRDGCVHFGRIGLWLGGCFCRVVDGGRQGWQWRRC